ncbi:MAG: VanZ family protein [Ruminococcaceae bacterium]|nr:VanZ family protein [Oscillospiraceae bacterium]
MFRSTKQKRISYIVFGVYSVLLIWLILFKLTINLSELPSIRGINLIPFHYDRETPLHSKELLYNIIVFVPFGIYIRILREHWKTSVKILTIFSASFILETAQFIFAIGASDITDIITNTLGGILGIYLCILMKKLTYKRYIEIFNTVGALTEIIIIGLMVLLFIMNK